MKAWQQWSTEIHPKAYKQFNDFIKWNDQLQNKLIDVNKAVEQYEKAEYMP